MVVNDVSEGELIDGIRPGWTHSTVIISADGRLQKEGMLEEGKIGWLGPYPENQGEYHCTAYFLDAPFPDTEINRSTILEVYKIHGIDTANMVGKYVNPLSS